MIDNGIKAGNSPATLIVSGKRGGGLGGKVEHALEGRLMAVPGHGQGSEESGRQRLVNAPRTRELRHSQSVVTVVKRFVGQ